MKNIFNSSDPVIGISMPMFWSEQFIHSLNGMRDASAKYNLNLICFQGIYYSSSFDSNGYARIERSGTIIYDLLEKSRLDGLVMHSYSLVPEHRKTLYNYCRSHFRIPMLNIGSKLETMPTLLIDNRHGMTELLNHLICDHGYRKIAFIRGPENNPDAQERFSTFTKVLSENSIPVVDELITLPGAWSFECGRNGVLDLLNNSGKDIDVIVCASDHLAAGAIYELTIQNVKVPDHICVTGFNDNSFARTCTPPLTTVNNKQYERSFKSIELFHEHFNGKPFPDKDIRTPSTLVIRQSCGCKSIGLQAIENSSHCVNIESSQNSIEANTSARDFKTGVLRELRLLKFHQPSDLLDLFLDSFIEQLDNTAQNTFIHTFGNILSETFSGRIDYDLWHLALSVIEDKLSLFVKNSDLAEARKFILQGHILISEVSAAKYKSERISITSHISSINSLYNSLINYNSLPEIIKLLYNRLPEIGLTSAYLSLYENTEQPSESLKLVLAFNKNGPSAIPGDGFTCNTQNLLPDGLSVDDRLMIIEPLFSNDSQIGFFLFGIDSCDKSHYSLLRSQLSASLLCATLIARKDSIDREAAYHSENITALGDKLSGRLNDLKLAAKQINDDQDQLMVYERMASLGKFTSGIIHEINTPIATLRASLLDMRKLANEYKSSITDTSVTSTDHKEIISDFKKSLDLAKKAVSHAHDFLKSILVQSRDVNASETKVFYLADIVHTVTLFLSHQLKQANCKIITGENDSLSPILGSPTKMTQVFTNLILNSIDAMENKKGGTIRIDMTNDTLDTTTIVVSDDGCGISEHNLPFIFEPLFTTKPFGRGTGLGLPIIHEIITRHFSGSISVESKIDKGTKFTIRIINNQMEYREFTKNGQKI